MEVPCQRQRQGLMRRLDWRWPTLRSLASVRGRGRIGGGFFPLVCQGG